MKKGNQVRLLCKGLFFWAFSVIFAPYHAAAATPQVVAGLYHNVALAVDGTVWTWGSNINGQLCAPDRPTEDPVPRPIPGLTDVIQVAAGGNFTLALKSDGTIWACGDNQYGQLGRNFVSGTNPQPNIWPIMDPTDPSSDFTLDAAGDGLGTTYFIAAGRDHALAVRDDGTVWGWGLANSGRLGPGYVTSSSCEADYLRCSLPFQVEDDAAVPLTGFTKVVAGFAHSMALDTSGDVWTWGDNYYGQLGLSPIPNPPGILEEPAPHLNEIHPPTKVPVLDSMFVTDINTGNSSYHSMAVANTQLYRWGRNDTYQLGNGNKTDRALPSTATLPAAPFGYSVITASRYFSLAVRTNNSVIGWGQNSGNGVGGTRGALGTGSETDITTPLNIASWGSISSMQAGEAHSAALRTDGTIWTSGDNTFMQLGSESGGDSLSPVQITHASTVTWPLTCDNTNLPLAFDTDTPPLGCDFDGDGKFYNVDDFCNGDDATGDSDGDGVCDDIDFCTGEDATGDSDGDGTCDDIDVCPGYDDYLDEDIDGMPDDCDDFPSDPAAAIDTDGDGQPDDWNPGMSDADSTTGLITVDDDDDNDGILDVDDAFPTDLAASLDTDGDGYPDVWNIGKTQADSTTGLTLDAFPADLAASLDTDGDGYPDAWNIGKTQADSTTGLTLDAFPADPAEWVDTDGDGTGDNADQCDVDATKTVPGVCGCGVADTDSDGDTYSDCIDLFPADPAEWLDADGDGTGDNADQCDVDATKTAPGVCGCGVADTDSDGDTYSDCIDLFPVDPAEWLDADGDGTGDNADQCDGDVPPISLAIPELRTGVDSPLDLIELPAASANLQMLDGNLLAAAYSIPQNTTDHTFLMVTNSQQVDVLYLYSIDNWGGGVPPDLTNWRLYSTDFLGSPWTVEAINPALFTYDAVNQRLVIPVLSVQRDYLKLVVDRNPSALPTISITEAELILVSAAAKTEPGICGCGVADTDSDADGLADCVDNCPATANTGQSDADGDTIGDVCDNCPNDPTNDFDGDGVCSDEDNCWMVSNPLQEDCDSDFIGDVCDTDSPCSTDTDGDGLVDSLDNCPTTSNSGQEDVDADGVGDVCDNCPSNSNPTQSDANSDSVGDVCDFASDTDNDGVSDGQEIIDGTDPLVSDNGSFTPDGEIISGSLLDTLVTGDNHVSMLQEIAFSNSVIGTYHVLESSDGGGGTLGTVHVLPDPDHTFSLVGTEYSGITANDQSVSVLGDVDRSVDDLLALEVHGRKGTGMTEASLTGEYISAAIAVDFSTWPPFVTERNLDTFSGDGWLDSINIEKSDGILDANFVPYNVFDTGELGLDGAHIGFVSADGEMYMSVDTDAVSDDLIRLVVGLRRGTGLSTGDLAGEFVHYQLGYDAHTLASRTVYTFNGSGGGFYMVTDDSEGQTNSAPIGFAYSVDADGNVTIGTEVVGTMSASGEFLVFADTDWLDARAGISMGVGVKSGNAIGSCVGDELSGDTDGDGVCDDLDLCDSDVTKTSPGQCGCSVADTDSDGDGIADCIDTCTGNNATGDSDGDGTCDDLDLCDSDAAKTTPGQCGCGVVDTDTDGDTVADCNDTCVGFNDLDDFDGDGIPDGCDLCEGNNVTGDSDSDGVCDDQDMCPGFDDKIDSDVDDVPDGCDICPGGQDLFDLDGDGVPDACDTCVGDNATGDTDSDGVCDDTDPCPVDNPDDTDGDGVCDSVDACPGYNDFVPDADTDGVSDACDACPGHNDALDADGDGVPFGCDICVGFDDAIDSDGDGVPDGCDPCPVDNPDDSDGDGVCDSDDPCPVDNPDDTDGDGVCDSVDACPVDNPDDSDSDGVCDSSDVCSGFDDSIDSDGDLNPDGCDYCPGFDDNVDSDGDGVPDGCDICPGFDDSIDSDGDLNPDGCDLCDGDDATGDTDGDGVCNDFDGDDDDDGVADGSDNCPVSANAGQVDNDGDGVGDVCDACPVDNPDDSDGDGVCNSVDVCVGDDASGDTDSDGVCDNTDACPLDPNNDADGDGVCDDVDAFPNDPAASVDFDGDGMPDDWNTGMYSPDSTTGLLLDDDDDSDGVLDDFDMCPGFDDTLDADLDGMPDDCDDFPTDPAAATDTDGDGLPDEWNPGMSDVDSTTWLTTVDDDDDDDGILDVNDAFPLDVTPLPDGISIPPTDDDNSGIKRKDKGDKFSNKDKNNGKPRKDLDYLFQIVIKDTPVNTITTVKLKINGHTKDMALEGGILDDGALYSLILQLGPANAHNFHFEAWDALDNVVYRYPVAGELPGPVIELLNGPNMVGLAKDISSSGFGLIDLLGSNSVYEWVSTGLTTDVTKGSYVALDSLVSHIPGQGYFIVREFAPSLPDLSAYGDTLAGTVAIDLRSGWNIVSNPYGIHINLVDVMVQKGVDTAVTWADACTNKWVINSIYSFLGSDWGSSYSFASGGGNPDASLTPWVGYWIYVIRDDASYKLIFNKP